jgi:hypothetical protein
MAPMGQPTPAADISWMGSVDFVFCYCQVQMGVESTMCGVNQSVHFFFVLKKSSEELIFFFCFFHSIECYILYCAEVDPISAPLLQFLIAGEFSSHPM